MRDFDKTNGQTVILVHFLMFSSGEYSLAYALIIFWSFAATLSFTQMVSYML